MNRVLLLSLLLAAASLQTAFAAESPEKAAPAKYEFAVVKWDGPDRLFYNLPDRFELVHLGKIKVEVPRDAQAEEWCLAYAANVMAKEGWEAVNLNSRRILFRRVQK